MRLFGSALLLMLLVFGLEGCEFFAEKPDRTKEWSAQRLYDSAKSSLNGGDYETAIDHFEKLISRHPFGLLAQQGQLEVAYAYYKFEEPASALGAADRFIELYPSHPSLDYSLCSLARARVLRSRAQHAHEPGRFPSGADQPCNG